MKVAGLDIEFEMELAQVTFNAVVNFSGSTSNACTGDADRKIYVDMDSEMVALVNERKKQVMLVPFNNVASMKPLRAGLGDEAVAATVKSVPKKK